MPYQRSPYFDTPATPKKLWKYMHIDKFLAMLDDNSLYFPNIVSFNDTLEGTLSYMSLLEIQKRYLLDDNTPIKQDDVFKKAKDYAEKYTLPHKDLFMYLVHSFQTLLNDFSNHLMFCNCWFKDKNESHSMWAEYGDKSPTSIAIQTTVSRLQKSIESTPYDIHIGQIKYKDYDTEHIEGYEEFSTKNLKDHGNILELFYAPIMHKRNIYKDEHEVRAVISFESFCQRHLDRVYTLEIPFYSDRLFSMNEAFSDPPKTNKMKGIHKGYSIEVNLQTLIEKVIISPYANSYFAMPLKHILAKYNLNPDMVDASKIKHFSYQFKRG